MIENKKNISREINLLDINVDFKETIKIAIEYVENTNVLISPSHDSVVNHKGIGIVYFIYLVDKKESKIKLVYIGKSKGGLFKTRIRNHFFKKHPKTGSKLFLINNELAKGNEVKLKFLKVVPESFRNTLEEELINHFGPAWNIQKLPNK